MIDGREIPLGSPPPLTLDCVVHRLHGCVKYRRRTVQGQEKIEFIQDINERRLDFGPQLDDAVASQDPLSESMAIKVGEGEANKEREPFRSAFVRFENELRQSNICVVVGFSFRDKHVAHQLFDAMTDGRLEKLICVDPFLKPDEIQERLRKGGDQASSLDSQAPCRGRICLVPKSATAPEALAQVKDYL
jgi:hypothetical protein